MRNNVSLSATTFTQLFHALLPLTFLRRCLHSLGLLKRRPPKISTPELLMGLVFHVLAGAGTFAQHVRDLTGKTLSDSALSQRRTTLPWVMFEMMLEAALVPQAQPGEHPEAFYHGLRLCGLDGSLFSVTNTPQLKAGLHKAKSRRHRAAFAKVGVAVLVELGLRNPIGAVVGPREESEMVLARQLLDRLPDKSLWLADRYSGVPVVLIEWQELHPRGRREFLVRVRRRLNRRVIQR